MAKLKRSIVKRRNVEAEQIIYDDKLPINAALERVMNIYSAEGYRDRTMNDYRKFWTEFFRIVDRPKYLTDVTTDDFRKFINVLLKKRGLSPVTVNIRMNGMRSMFNRLFAEGLMPENPVAPIRKLKTDEQAVGALTDDQLKRLFAQIDKTSFAGYRDYCAMITMLKMGLRINEINALEIADIDFDNGVVMLPGSKNKNRKNRAIPLPSKVASELTQLIKETQEFFGTGIKTVFINNTGEALNHDLIRKRMYKYGTDAGLKGECRYSPHNLRHTFAVRYLKHGGDIRSLAQIMGHSDISTTQVYLNFTNDDVKNQFQQVDKKDFLNL